MFGNTSLLQAGEKGVRLRVQEALQRYGLKQVDVARETGVHHSSLSLWLQGKLKGNYAKIEETLEDWLKSINNKKPAISGQQVTANNQMDMSQLGDGQDMNQGDALIPISVDIEIEGQRFREFFCWNVYEPFFSPESFAKSIAEENNFPIQFENEIAQTIKRFLHHYKQYEPKSAELLRVIEIDVRIDNVQVKDRFEWDINDPANNPDQFAQQLCEELGLTTEFMVRIAHQIREQIQYFQKQVALKKGQTGVVQGFDKLKKSTRSLLEQSSQYNNALDIKSQIQPRIITEENYIRSIAHEYEGHEYLSLWEPKIDFLDENEIKKIQKLEDRKTRYVRRNN